MATYNHTLRRQCAGFTYIGILIAVAVTGIMLAGAGSLWSTAAQRDREVDLLRIGHEFRQAIERYYIAGHDGVHSYPPTLEDLVEDSSGVITRRYLRRIYRDPMTGAADWRIVASVDGGIAGVYSSSQARPMKQANFEPADRGFGGVQCYCDWKFVYSGSSDPRQAAQQ